MPRAARPRLVASLLAASALLGAGSASAEEEDDGRGFAAFVTGAATALVPVIVGATITAAGKTDGAKDVGFVVAGAGLALAPFTAHAVVGEWGRGALFMIVPALSEGGIAALVTAEPDAIFHGTTVTRTSFGVLFSVDVFIGALGVVDAALAGGRAKKLGLWTAPTVAGAPGLTVGGTL